MSSDYRSDTRHVIYVSRRHFQDPHGDRLFVVIYDTMWEGQQGMRALLRDDELLWETDDWVRSSSGVVLRVRKCRTTPATLRQLWEYERSTKEMALDLSPNLVREAHHIREGAVNPNPTTEPRRRGGGGRRGPSVPPPSGAIHVKDLALSMGIEARVARGVLRKLMKKPAHGWWFKPDEVDGVKRQIQEKM